MNLCVNGVSVLADEFSAMSMVRPFVCVMYFYCRSSGIPKLTKIKMSWITFETENQAYRVFQRLVHYDRSWAIFGKTLQSPFAIHTEGGNSDSFYIAVLGGNIQGVIDHVNASSPPQQSEFRKRMLNTISVLNIIVS